MGRPLGPAHRWTHFKRTSELLICALTPWIIRQKIRRAILGFLSFFSSISEKINFCNERVQLRQTGKHLKWQFTQNHVFHVCVISTTRHSAFFVVAPLSLLCVCVRACRRACVVSFNVSLLLGVMVGGVLGADICRSSQG